MAFKAVQLPLFSSIETLILDVQNVTSSELSRKQLAALIEDEFHMESDHMGNENGPLNCQHAKEKLAFFKSKALSIFLSLIKWTVGIFFIFLLAIVLAPERTADSLNALPGVVSLRQSVSGTPKYRLSDIDWYFYVLQIARWSSTSFKIERRFPIIDQDLEACIVDNPLFKAQQVKCSICKKISGYRSKLNDSSFDHPIVIEDEDIEFSLGRLQHLLRRNEIMVNQYTISIITNCDYVQTIEDLQNNDVLERLENNNASHIVGTSVSYMSSHILRKEFPRPQEYLTHAAQTYKNYIYIDGKDSPSFKLQTSVDDSNFMYVQTSGSRRLVFTPPVHCFSKCNSFSVVMKKGAIAFYSRLWSVYSEPIKSNEKSFAFVDNFEWIP